MGDLEFLFVLLLAAALLVRVADRVAVPYPIVLVLAGLGVGAIPGLPDVRVDPEVLFLVFLPPLLTVAGYTASPQELRAAVGSLTWLALVLVLVTMALVAVVAHALVDGLSWPVAFVLGAVLAPTDPVAAAATFTRLGVPDRVALLVEGEAMINDATALTAYRVAVTAAAGGAFSAGHSLLAFVGSAAGGVAIGVVVGWAEVWLLRRQEDTSLAIVLTLLVPYAAYIAGDRAGVSGVLSAVVAALWLGWHSHSAFKPDTRLSAQSFWNALELGLDALLFVLLGLQVGVLVDDLRAVGLTVGDLLGPALAITALLVALRIAFTAVPALADTWRERLTIGWCGMRGAISLAAALAVPDDVAGRPQVILITVVVIFVTLVGQGLTLPLLLRLLGIHGTRPWSPEEAVARLEAAQAALDRIDELEDEGAPEELVRRMRELYRARFRQCQAALGGDPEAADRERSPRMRFGEVRRELIRAERATLLDLRAEGRLRPDTLRAVERDLDLEEARLRVG